MGHIPSAAALPCPVPAHGGISVANARRALTHQRHWSCPVAPGQQKLLHFSPGQEGRQGAKKPA